MSGHQALLSLKRRAAAKLAAGASAKRRDATSSSSSSSFSSSASASALDDDEPERAEDDEIYLSYFWPGASASSRVGVALFSRVAGDLSLASAAAVGDHDCAAVAAVVVAQFAATRPAYAITSSATPDAARRALAGERRVAPTGPEAEADAGDRAAAAAAAFDDEEGDGGGGTPVQVLKAASFAPVLCRDTLLRCTTGEWQRMNRAAGPSSATSSSSYSSAGALSSARMGSVVDMADLALVRAAGGLINFLLQRKVIYREDDEGRAFDDDEGGGSIVLPGRVRMLSLSSFMQIDALSLSALSVVPPGGAKKGAKCGERVTLFELLDRAACESGRACLRQWLQQPSLDRDELIARHDAVGFLITARKQCPEEWASLRRALKKVKNLPPLFARLRAFRARTTDWLQLQAMLFSSSFIRDILETMASLVNVPSTLVDQSVKRSAAAIEGGDWSDASTPFSAQAPKLLRNLLADLGSGRPEQLQNMLDNVIDWEASRERKRNGVDGIVVQCGLDPSLDEYRKVQDDLLPFLAQAASNDLPALTGLRSLSYTYFPQIGIVAVVDKRENGLLPPYLHVGAGAGAGPGSAPPRSQSTGMPPPGTAASVHFRPLLAVAETATVQSVVPGDWVLSFETADALHYKSKRCADLDDYFGDLAGAIADLEAGIVRQLEDAVVAKSQDHLYDVGRQLAELDALCCYAEVSEEGSYVRPKLVKDPVIFVKQARNPLQELALGGPERLIANDIGLALNVARAGPIALLTGPNASGKSVYLRTVGIIPILAQAGCFVPAALCQLGLVDKVYTRIHSLESSSVGASTFTIDVQAIGVMCRHATPRSLLLIDEFGKGTSSIDGVALLAATIRFLLHGVGGAPPRTIITSHFREIFDLGLLSLPLDGGQGVDGTAGALSRHVSAFHMAVDFRQEAVSIPAEEGDEAGADGVLHEDIVAPLFKLVAGHAASSYGLACARRGGVPVAVVERARIVTECMRSHTPVARLPLRATGADVAALQLCDALMSASGGGAGLSAAQAAALVRRAIEDE